MPLTNRQVSHEEAHSESRQHTSGGFLHDSVRLLSARCLKSATQACGVILTVGDQSRAYRCRSKVRRSHQTAKFHARRDVRPRRQPNAANNAMLEGSGFGCIEENRACARGEGGFDRLADALDQSETCPQLELTSARSPKSIRPSLFKSIFQVISGSPTTVCPGYRHRPGPP